MLEVKGSEGVHHSLHNGSKPTELTSGLPSDGLAYNYPKLVMREHVTLAHRMSFSTLLRMRQPGCMLHEAGYSHTGANTFMYTLIHMCCVLSRMHHSAVVCVCRIPARSCIVQHCVWQLCCDTNSRSVWTSLLLGTKMNNEPVCACAYRSAPQRDPN